LPESSSTEATSTTTAHHAEQDFGIDAAHTTPHTTATEHVSWVKKIVAIVISCLFPVLMVSIVRAQET
jgi:hypothetical protein